MNTLTHSGRWLALALALGFVVTAQADNHMMKDNSDHESEPVHRQGVGPGMMYGPDSMMGYGMGGPMMGYGMMHGGPMMGGMGMTPCSMMGVGQGGYDYGLQLDEKQQEQMNKLCEKRWNLQQEHMKEMWEHHNEMQVLWQDGTPDSDKVLKTHRKMQKEQQELLEEQLKLQKEMEEVLTEEQRQQLRQAWQKMYRGGQ